MVFDMAKEHLRKVGLEDRIYKFEVSSAMVRLAVQVVGYEPARVARTLSFTMDQKAVLIVVVGDARTDNHKYREQFCIKTRMLLLDEVMKMVDHSVRGVCPFGVKGGVSVYLDEPPKRFGVAYLACGSANSMVKFMIPELGTTFGYLGWVDVCEGWRGGW